MQAQPAGRIESAFKRTCRIRGVRGFLWEAVRSIMCEVPMGSGALCISCNLHKDSPAPQAEEGAGSACRAD